MAPNKTKLSRSTKNRLIAGVCGGIAEFFHVDANIVRLIFVLLIFVDGTGAIAYLLLWILMPRNVKGARRTKKQKIRLRQIFGALILVIGILWFSSLLHPTIFIRWQIVWSLVILMTGVAVIIKNRKEHAEEK